MSRRLPQYDSDECAGFANIDKENGIRVYHF
jgi:hypothetical protein